MENMKSYKPPDELPAELIQLVAETSHFECIIFLITFRNEEKFP
jgi:hypothetical protein